MSAFIAHNKHFLMVPRSVYTMIVNMSKFPLISNKLNIAMVAMSRSSPSEVFLQKVVLKIYSKFTGEHSC